MKWILSCHNFCSWHHQQNFFTLLKLKCRCGHVRKFENQSILTIEVIVTLFYKDLGRKTDCFEGWSWFKFDNLWLVLSMTLKFYSSVAKKKKVKNKDHKVSKTNSYRGIQSKECYFMFTYSFLSFFIKKFVFSSFSFLFLWSIKIPQQNINHSETGIDDEKLPVELHEKEATLSTSSLLCKNAGQRHIRNPLKHLW